MKQRNNYSSSKRSDAEAARASHTQHGPDIVKEYKQKGEDLVEKVQEEYNKVMGRIAIPDNPQQHDVNIGADHDVLALGDAIQHNGEEG